jgi:hypothetical protein
MATVRVVLAELGSPGSIHYLLEAEGFQVVGCASDEHDLERVLAQDLHPDAIVLDADIVATSVLVARRHEPDAHVVVIWPDGVQPPRGADRVSPGLVYEELGPTIRRHAGTERVPEPIIVLPDDVRSVPLAAPDEPGPGLGRTASRVSLTTVTLLAAIVFTMGVSFALARYRFDATAQRTFAPKASLSAHHTTPDPAAGREDMPQIGERGLRGCERASHGQEPSPCADGKGKHRRPAPHEQGGSISEQIALAPTGGGGPPPDPGGDQGNGGDDQGHHGGSPGDQGNQDDGGNQDDQGEDEQGDQGGNQGDQGNQDDQGSGDQGGQASQADDRL